VLLETLSDYALLPTHFYKPDDGMRLERMLSDTFGSRQTNVRQSLTIKGRLISAFNGHRYPLHTSAILERVHALYPTENHQETTLYSVMLGSPESFVVFGGGVFGLADAYLNGGGGAVRLPYCPSIFGESFLTDQGIATIFEVYAKEPNAIDAGALISGVNRWFLIVMQPKDWPALPAAIGHPELLSDPRFADDAARAKNSGQLAANLDTIFAAQTLAHWHDVFERARITYGIVKTPMDITTDPQVLANEIIVPIEGGGEQLTRTVSSPIKIHGVPKAAARRGPELGEHNDEVLRELGFSADQIEGFRISATIPQKSHDAEVVGGKR